jgi:hypothetical protein
MMDANGDLRYSRIFDDLLPTVVDEHFYAIWQIKDTFLHDVPHGTAQLEAIVLQT